MKRLSLWGATAITVLWALFTFIASNSPADVEQRTNGWLALPILREMPERVIAFASNPLVFALSFFGLGAAAGWHLARWQLNRINRDWWSSLGVEMSLLAYEIENGIYPSDMNRINADIDVIRVNADRHGLPFPKRNHEFPSVQSLLPYLTRVSAHLKAGNVEHARSTAKQICGMSIL